MLTPKPRDVTWQLAAAFAGAMLAVALLAGQVFAWIERRRIDWVGAA